MTDEEKKILLKDLCARLPYGVIITNGKDTRVFDSYVMPDVAIENGQKPYLRPLSSMTKKERKEYAELDEYDYVSSVDFMISHHFDFRGLIPMGLALEAKEGMYNLK